MRQILVLLILLFFSFAELFSQCKDPSGVIYKTKSPLITFDDLAHYAAPMLWFSPDEANLYTDDNIKSLPNSFPFDGDKKRVVYYKYKTIFSINDDDYNLSDTTQQDQVLDLREVRAVSMEYYYYFAEETGLGNHPHDIESTAFQLEISLLPNCPDYNYAISIIRVIGRAHGVKWFDHVLDVDNTTFLPVSILIEEGKHASITDRNADGVYTPTYDVTRRVNDAWGARDIISTGKLVSGGYQAWMAKQRVVDDIVFPPTPKDHPNYIKYKDKFPSSKNTDNMYSLRRYPDYPRTDIDKLLNKKMKEKKYHNWPRVKHLKYNTNPNLWRKEDAAFRSLSLAYRWDDSRGLTLTTPLLFFRTVEAPMTGGWLVNKFSFGLGETSVSDSTFIFEKAFGHSILYTSSASKWLDTYVSFGYEILDTDIDTDVLDYDLFLASEAGLKIRLNITKTPLKFLKHLGTEYWGIRVGWRNTGFSTFVNSGLVLEIGAGVF